MVPGANILDQLLGGFEVKPTGPTGQAGATGSTGVSAEGMEQGLLFGDLLLQSMTEGAPGEEIISNLLFPSNDRPEAQDRALAGPTVEQGSLLELVASLKTASVETAPVEIAPVETAPVEIAPVETVSTNVEKLITLGSDFLTTPNATLINAEKPLDLALPNQTNLTNLTNPEALPQLETKLESGAFRILDSKLIDGRLELTAIAENSPDEPVKISVPESVLKEAALRLATGNVENRVAPISIDGLPSTKSVLDEIMSQLNLKVLEIKVEPETTPTAKSPQSPVEVTIIAEQSGAEVVLKGKITRQGIQVRSEQKNPNNSARTSESNTPNETETKNPVTSKAATLDVGADNLRRGANLNQFTLADRFGGNRAGMTNENFALQSSFDNTLEPLTTSVERKMAPMVKMTLPDLIQKPFSAGGQTIMIKIEPEHLGPARLNLVLRGQVLTARVVVDTPMARMAVLNSLEQLTDQLSRAGVDIDRIDVTLSGDSTREQFLDHRPAWEHAQKTRRFDDELENGTELLDTAPIMTAPSTEYIGADRVNLLA